MPNATKPVQNTEKAQHIHDPALTARRVIAYIVLFFLSFLCLFFFYVLIVNATHNNFTIQQGFDPMPRGSFANNFYNTTHDANVPILTGLRNSLINTIPCVLTLMACTSMAEWVLARFDHLRAYKILYAVLTPGCSL